MQLFYNLSDPAMEDALHEIESMRSFAGLSLSGAIPDETTILNFRHLEKEGLLLREGTIVDATIIAVPSSTKNREGKRDPEMHQTKKGNEWHFGMKMHIGVDDSFGVIHSLETTPANIHDITQTQHLLHGEESFCCGDAGYQGVEKREELAYKAIDWCIAMRPGKRKQLTGIEAKREQIEAQIRAKVEHPFRYIKRQFGCDRVRYRGLAKNNDRLHVLSAFTNLLICKKWLLT